LRTIEKGREKDRRNCRKRERKEKERK